MACPPPVRARLIICADDLGYSPSRDAGILALAAAGAVSAASLLVTGASARGALAAAAAAGLPVGLHANLTEGRPAAPAAAVASLLDARGLFLGKAGLRAALDAGRVDEAHVAAELAAQFALFRALHPRGAAPAHADGHQHAHVCARVAAPFAAAARAAGVRWTRLPAARRADAAADGARAAFYARVDADARAAAPIFAAAGLRWADAFVGFSTQGADGGGAERALALLRGAAAAGARAVEWMVHPGRAVAGEPAGCGDGADDFSLARDRDAEAEALGDGALREWVRGHARLCAGPEAAEEEGLGGFAADE